MRRRLLGIAALVGLALGSLVLSLGDGSADAAPIHYHGRYSTLDRCNRVLVQMAVDGHFRDTTVPPACVFLSTIDGRGYYVRHAY